MLSFRTSPQKPAYILLQVTKRENESSLMQLKDEFCHYDMLRREHDSQIIQIAHEAGLRIAPDQWSSLLYGDSVSHRFISLDWMREHNSYLYRDCSRLVWFYSHCPMMLQHHKPLMQSIIDRLQTPQAFSQGIKELVVALNRTNDPAKLTRLEYYLQQVNDLTGNVLYDVL